MRSGITRWLLPESESHAVDADHVGARAVDPCAHRLQAVRRDRPPPARAPRSPAPWCPRPGVAAIMRFSVPVTVTRSITMRAPSQPLGDRVHVAMLDLDLRAHCLQALDVLVHRPRADAAAAGQRHLGATAAREQRPQHQHRGAHGLHQLVAGDRVLDRGRAQLRCRSSCAPTSTPIRREQLRHGAHVHQARHVARARAARRSAVPRT